MFHDKFQASACHPTLAIGILHFSKQQELSASYLIERPMIRQKSKKSITWLLIAGMLHLMLIAAPSGMVMASPLEIIETADLQSVGMDMPSCHSETLSTADHLSSQADCDNCKNNTCTNDCSYCAHISIGLNSYNLELPAKPERLASTTFSPQPFDPGYTPTPHPPKQSNS